MEATWVAPGIRSRLRQVDYSLGKIPAMTVCKGNAAFGAGTFTKLAGALGYSIPELGI